MEAERAHELGLKVLKLGLPTPGRFSDDEKAEISRILGPIKRFGIDFPNPLGIAAGFDKNGVVVNQLARLGFGFVEVGTVTFEPQAGNSKPRLFRLPYDKALINRLGFNNDGAARVAERLSKISKQCIVGVNIGRNKAVNNEDAVQNYLKTFETVYPVADYIAVNVSSPNTPNLRKLQTSENLETLINALQVRNAELGSKPLLVKIAPDLDEAEIESIIDVCIRLNVSGIIATNTTVTRDNLKTRSPDRFGEGGLSGRPLSKISNQVIEQIYRYSNGNLPIIGVGGVFSAEDAFEKFARGASLVQAYTGFIYGGPSFPATVVRGLAKLVKAKGFLSLDELAGSAVK
jgi:dihydroorotate dehydrogenase